MPDKSYLYNADAIYLQPCVKKHPHNVPYSIRKLSNSFKHLHKRMK